MCFGLGRAQGSTGQHHDAWGTLTRAFDYFEDAGDVAMAVAVAEYPLLFVAGLERTTGMVERAPMLVEPDSHEAGGLLSRNGLSVNLETGDHDRAKEFFDRALVTAERENDRVLEMRTLSASADADWYQLREKDTLAKCLRVIELARLANDSHAEAWPHFLAAFALLVTGDPSGASPTPMRCCVWRSACVTKVCWRWPVAPTLLSAYRNATGSPPVILLTVDSPPIPGFPGFLACG